MNKKSSLITPSKLIELLSEQLYDLPDKRTGENTKYEVKEAVMAAFSVFFTQSGSFLENQRIMKENKGKNNAKSLFGISKIPSDNQIRNLLDVIEAKKVFGTFKKVLSWLKKSKIIEEFKYLKKEILVSLDGTEYYCSKKISCSHCNQRNHKNGDISYYHQVITPVIVSPLKKQVINLEPEFIRKQDGKTKQDCENVATKRWLLRNKIDRKKEKITLLGDDLYSRQPICEMAIKQGYNFIFVAKESSHQSLYEWIEYLQKNGEVVSGEFTRYEKAKQRIYKYKYVNNVPMRELEPSLMVNWLEVEVIDVKKNKVIYKNSWITNHTIKKELVEPIIISGRTRWKVENEGNNILKNQGYKLEHNYGHGQENLSEILLTLNLIAFLFHNVLELANEVYQKVRKKLVVRKSFFNEIRTLLKYIWFKDWSELLIYMLTRGEKRKLIDTS